MIYSILTRDFGPVQLTRNADGTGTAYFLHGDMEYEIDRMGRFMDYNSVGFRVLWPVPNHKTMNECVLEVLQWKEIGRD